MFKSVVSAACVDAGRVLGCGSCCEEGMETRRWVARARGRPRRLIKLEMYISAVVGGM